ncbi:Nif11 family protein [Roseomonas sp. GC11]|uniref:Nif11 family protein n=1 Tax=Roseomonas sp. GC11 TaxID=2950546 RepID=UPI00210EB60B|nr:Nif11 family protein [Roseomonas sp. GC11]MCQ4162721.1 Nif11 family protein [Roseomonas sp. GC11]
MSSQELHRLAQDMQDQPALRETIAAALSQCRGVTEAAGLLQSHGYAISAEALSPAALTDEMLDHVSAGSGGATTLGFFQDLLNSIQRPSLPALRGAL